MEETQGTLEPHAMFIRIRTRDVVTFSGNFCEFPKGSEAIKLSLVEEAVCQPRALWVKKSFASLS